MDGEWNHHRYRNMGKLLTKSLQAIFLIVFLFFNGFNAIALADGADIGQKIFNTQCAGCHINGGNIIRRGKNLKLRTLHRYGMDSVDAISEIVSNGKNNMSAYKDKLTHEEIEEVAVYVLKQAENNWK